MLSTVFNKKTEKVSKKGDKMQCTAQTVLYSQAESVFASELSDYRSQHIKRLFGSAVYFSIKLLYM